MHAPNDELIANITKQLEDLQQINHVLASVSFSEYLKRYTQFKQAFLQRGYKNGEHPPWDLLLDNFDFAHNSRDPRTHKMRQAFAEYHGAQPDGERCAPSFFQLLYMTFQNIHQHKTTNFHQCNQVRQLIAEQITTLQQRLTRITRPQSQQSSLGDRSTQQPSPLSETINPTPSRAVVHSSPYFLSRNKAIAAVGFGLMGVSLLLHLNPTFALLVGIHLSPALFVLLVIIGACMAGYGLSRKDASPPPNTDTSVLPPPFYGRQVEQLLKFCFSFGRSENHVALNSSSDNQGATSKRILPRRYA